MLGKELHYSFLGTLDKHGFIMSDSGGEVENWQSRSAAESLLCFAKSEGLAEALEERWMRAAAAGGV